jgi:tetratricopeptide (TPR) repeat protein
LSVYTPLIDFYILIDELDLAWEALAKAKGNLTTPLDKFLGFSEADLNVQVRNLAAAKESLQRAREVVDQFQLKFLESVLQIGQARISMAEDDPKASANHLSQAVENIGRAVVSSEQQVYLPMIYADLAKAQIKSGNLDDADKSVDAGFRLDRNEPELWVAKAHLQYAQDMPRMALASVNYALAIWHDADENYRKLKEARKLALDLQANIQ